MTFKEKKKTKNDDAHTAQLSRTLVCLEPTALFWDNIRGLKIQTTGRVVSVWQTLKTVSFSFSGSFFRSFSSPRTRAMSVSRFVSVSFLLVLELLFNLAKN